MHMAKFFSKNIEAAQFWSLVRYFTKVITNSFKYIFKNFDRIFIYVLYRRVMQFQDMFRSSLKKFLFFKKVFKKYTAKPDAEQIYQNHTLVWMFSCCFVGYILQKRYH